MEYIGSIKRHHFSGQIETIYENVLESESNLYIEQVGTHGKTFDMFHPERKLTEGQTKGLKVFSTKPIK